MGFASHCHPLGVLLGTIRPLVVLPGVVVNYFLVFFYAGSSKSLAYGSDDGAAMGIIFLVEGITMIDDLNLQD